MHSRWLLALALLAAPAAASAGIIAFNARVEQNLVTYTVEVDVPGTLDLYYDRDTAPGEADQGDDRRTLPVAQQTTFEWTAPNGVYHSYAQFRASGTGAEVAGPIEVVVGPDLVLCSFTQSITGNSVRYEARACNMGSLAAGPFRVGLWFDRQSAPAAGEREDQFVANIGLASIWTIVTAPPCWRQDILTGEITLSGDYCSDHGQSQDCCPEVSIDSGPLPNGSYRSWAMVDSADFVKEANELNNLASPLDFTLSLPDIVVTRFTASVHGASVTYAVDLCNRGTAAASQFYVDVYYDRKLAPQPGFPGELIQGMAGMSPGECQHLNFVRGTALDGVYRSWVLADADDFLVEPDKLNNRKGPLEVTVTRGEGCVDGDEDGFGVGLACDGPQDCDDADQDIHPGAAEVCGDGIDQNCNRTVDDGCPGVDCTDGDGDGWPVGPDCAAVDCDDADATNYPGAPEICGNAKDDSCNGIIDDGCPGTLCVDEDGDGYGVGPGCPGPQDGDDHDPDTHPGAEEICGDGEDNNCNGIVDDGCPGCTDDDGDGYGVGDGCGPLLERDCDDADAFIHPGAEEICGDGIDNNCNTSVDEGCEEVDCQDADGDGWPVGDDCGPYQDSDDTDPTVYPGAPEVCGDGIDQNSNGTPDDGCPGVDCNDVDGDNWPAGTACLVTDCDDGDASIHPGAREICADGIDQDCDGTADDGCRHCEDLDHDGFALGPECPVDVPRDCDDDDPHVYPGAPESCRDGRDSNCDGVLSPAESCKSAGGCDCGDGGGSLPDGGADAAAMLGLALLGVLGRRPRR